MPLLLLGCWYGSLSQLCLGFVVAVVTFCVPKSSYSLGLVCWREDFSCVYAPPPLALGLSAPKPQGTVYPSSLVAGYLLIWWWGASGSLLFWFSLGFRQMLFPWVWVCVYLSGGSCPSPTGHL